MAASELSSKEENECNNSRTSSSDRCSYSLSADVSESETSSCISISGLLFNNAGASTSLISSPHCGAFRTVSVTDSVFPSAFSQFGGKDDVMVWEKKHQKKQPDSDLSGSCL